MAISMTTAAQQHVRKHLQHRSKGAGVRLGVRTTGCSGLSYVLEFVDDITPDDQTFKFDDVVLVIDPKSLVYLDGTELDYVKEGLNEGFEFRNSNVKDECGFRAVVAEQGASASQMAAARCLVSISKILDTSREAGVVVFQHTPKSEWLTLPDC